MELSGFTADAGLSGRPYTPPYTSYRNKGKRRLERSHSPASSVHPTETNSPAKKQAKRPAVEEASVKVEELLEGDVRGLSDIDVVYPEELEEAGSTDDGDGDDERSSSGEADAQSDADGIAKGMSRLRCKDEKGEAKFEKGRRQRRLSKRIGSRVFKRSHSRCVKSETEEVMVTEDDHDVATSQRRLRRRVKGPRENEGMF